MLAEAPGASDARHRRLVGEGFAIEVPTGFAAAVHPTAGAAWAAEVVDGMGARVRVIAWAEVQDAHDLQAFADARSAAITTAGGQVRVVSEATLFGLGRGPDRPAKRIVATNGDARLITQLYVVDGHGYAITCESPRRSLADADCAGIVASFQTR